MLFDIQNFNFNTRSVKDIIAMNSGLIGSVKAQATEKKCIVLLFNKDYHLTLVTHE